MANTLALEAYINTGGGLAWTAVGGTDKLYFQKAGAFAYGSAGAIPITEANGGTHVIDASNDEVCDTADPSNVAYVAAGTCSINGGGTVDVNTLAITNCWRMHGAASPNAEITTSGMYVYGSAEANPISGVAVYGVKQGESAWADVGGSAARLELGTSVSAADHYKYFALSVVPATNGAKTGTVKMDMTFV